MVMWQASSRLNDPSADVRLSAAWGLSRPGFVRFHRPCMNHHELFSQCCDLWHVLRDMLGDAPDALLPLLCAASLASEIDPVCPRGSRVILARIPKLSRTAALALAHGLEDAAIRTFALQAHGWVTCEHVLTAQSHVSRPLA